MGYREDYEEHYKMRLDRSWEVHHIDYNHDNNDMNNLVAIPDYLHRKLHKAHFRFELAKQNFTLSDIKIHSGKLCSHTEFMSALSDYIETVEKCTPYINLRNFGNYEV